MRRLTLILTLAVAVAACGDSADSDTTAAPADTVAPTTTPGGTTAPPATTTPAATTAPAETVAPASTIAEAIDVRALIGIDAVDLGAAASGERRPVLSWGAVDAATRYALVVLDAAGAPYWAWSGTATTVRFGGNGEGDNGQVALLHEQMTWRITAFDETGTLLAISDEGTLQP